MAEADERKSPLSTAEKLLQQQQKVLKNEAILKEEEAEWKECLLRLFNTSDGEHFGKKLVKACRLFAFDETIDPTSLVVDKIRSEFYLRWIRPYLDEETLNKLERK
jgi:hypothetical protein